MKKNPSDMTIEELEEACGFLREQREKTKETLKALQTVLEEKRKALPKPRPVGPVHTIG